MVPENHAMLGVTHGERSVIRHAEHGRAKCTIHAMSTVLEYNFKLRFTQKSMVRCNLYGKTEISTHLQIVVLGVKKRKIMHQFNFNPLSTIHDLT